MAKQNVTTQNPQNAQGTNSGAATATQADVKQRTNSHDFIVAWMETFKVNGTIDDVANRLNVQKANIYQRTKVLKQKGVQLPDLRETTPRKIDPEELNKLIQEMKNEKKEAVA